MCVCTWSSPVTDKHLLKDPGGTVQILECLTLVPDNGKHLKAHFISVLSFSLSDFHESLIMFCKHVNGYSLRVSSEIRNPFLFLLERRAQRYYFFSSSPESSVGEELLPYTVCRCLSTVAPPGPVLAEVPSSKQSCCTRDTPRQTECCHQQRSWGRNVPPTH